MLLLVNHMHLFPPFKKLEDFFKNYLFSGKIHYFMLLWNSL